jgi:hypothetical protein
MEKVVTRWLITQDRDWCRQGIGKLVPQYDNCLGYGGDYVYMQWDNSTTECERLVLDLEVKIT